MGESFRLGGQSTRNRGSPESYNEQKMACKTHVEFMNKYSNELNFDFDIIIHSYTTRYQDELVSWYPNEKIIKKVFHSEPIGYNNIVNKSIDNIDISKYDFMQFIRIDLYLKPEFIFTISNKIRFSFVCWKKLCVYNGVHRVADMMLYIPSNHFDKGIYLSHEAYYDYLHNTSITENDMEFCIPTNHDSDSAKDFNPLYYIVNRIRAHSS